MTDLIAVIEKLLKAYEHSTPSIDQGLVSRVQACLQFCRKLKEAGI